MNRFALVRVVLVVGAVSTVSLAAPTLLPMPPSGASEPSGALEALSGREELSGASTMRQPQVDLTPAVPSHGQGLDVREPLAIADVFVDPVTGTDDLSYTDNTWSSGDVDVDAREVRRSFLESIMISVLTSFGVCLFIPVHCSARSHPRRCRGCFI
ncbi:hypothetical protein F5878DRAFT_408889 [Lentinula raphanica]|uniref:Uncharacterized protein n=1 Tax=Lentinula raphanica TaxID=153919 RepID=A0AA38NZG7_9AGAR|nr:hypothetical protein F5878DRAFT_408889 [Lentinula raphanica]